MAEEKTLQISQRCRFLGVKWVIGELMRRHFVYYYLISLGGSYNPNAHNSIPPAGLGASLCHSGCRCKGCLGAWSDSEGLVWGIDLEQISVK